MATHKLSAFAACPLISPARLKTNPREALAIMPSWVSFFAFLSDEEDGFEIEHEKIAFIPAASYARGGRELWKVPVVSLALLCETTRYSGSGFENSNKNLRADEESFYLKLSLPGAGKGRRATAWRIILGVSEHEAVAPGGDDDALLRRDLHPDNLSIINDGHAHRDARADAIMHVRQSAEMAGVPAAEVAAYVDNYRRLFDYHDELYGLALPFGPKAA